MAIFLAQHGLAQAREIDPEQGLSARGEAEVERIAAVARGYKIRPTLICHSQKKRARQTAEIFAEALEPGNGCREISGLAPLDDVEGFAQQLKSNTLYVGHLPFMARLTGLLTAGSPQLAPFKFQNGGIVCLEQGDEGLWQINWALMPNISSAS
ncbi:MAG: phosphohistidine phosphatase SixA [Thermodesulfobacteriota bacterium]